MRIPKLIEEHKDVFGAYSTMALSNIQTVLDYICERANLKEPDGGSENYWDHPVMQCLAKGNERSEVSSYIHEKLLRSFPFLGIFAECQRNSWNEEVQIPRREISDADIHWVLNNAFRVLKAYRDTCAHYLIENKLWNDGSPMLMHNERPLASMVNRYYTVALRITAERYGYTVKDLAFIQDHRYIQIAQKDERGNDILLANGRKKKTMVPNLDFFLSLMAVNGDTSGARHLSGWGVALLICLFLEKKYVNVFLSKLPSPGRYAADTKESKIIRRSMAICSIVLPRERIHSDKGTMSVAMDMLNELKRCPRELFGTLNPEKQERFRQVSSDYNEVLLMRSTDRFPQLLLQYIDYRELFSKLRFHVNMGKLRYLFNPMKYCIDGQTRVRVIEHPLNGFGRLSEMEAERITKDGTFAGSGIKVRRFDEIERDDADPANYPYIVDTYTHYVLENGHVEMRFIGGDGMAFPEIEHAENDKWYVNKDVPHCRMSVLELPAMAFHMRLCGAKCTEERIEQMCDAYFYLFNAMAQGSLTKENILSFGIRKEDIPQKVWDCVNGKSEGKDVAAFQKKEIASRLKDVRTRIERLEMDKKAVLSKDNKMGKRGFVHIVPGRLADYLAREICRLQPSLQKGDRYGTDRLTGMNYRVLQAAIATYNDGGDGVAYKKLRDMFVNAGLIGGRQEHPFLTQVLPVTYSHRCPRNTADFYELYLHECENYLEKFAKKIAMGKKPQTPFVNTLQRKWASRDESYYRELGEWYKSMPIDLPRQMFDEDIRAQLKQMPEMADVDFSNANVTWLIGEYLKRVRHDDFQNFYSWARHYRYVDMLKCEVDYRQNTLMPVYTELMERDRLWQDRVQREAKYASFYRKKLVRGQNMDDVEGKIEGQVASCKREFQKSEQAIRRFKVQDALMFWMATDALIESVDFDSRKFNLKDIMPDSDKGILSEVVPLDFHFEKEVTIGKREKELVRGIIHSDKMKIKNYGDFYALTNDRRLGTLTRIVPNEKLQKEELEEEFNQYDDSRPRMVSLVFDLEKWAYAKYPELKELVADEKNYGSLFNALLKELQNRDEITGDEKYSLVGIRNAFCHNSYPQDIHVVRIKVIPKVARDLINTFGEYIARE